ncbi:MAG: hypothetical protein V3U75_01835 [Methylococcaceae bacterium]
MTNIPEARCAECLNLESDNWCKARKRTVPGSRHKRNCSYFEHGSANPKPERPGKPNHANLVQCSSCQQFAGWGQCADGLHQFGLLNPRIWRNCEYFVLGQVLGCCQACVYLKTQVCMQSRDYVSNPEVSTTCQMFTSVDLLSNWRK